MSHPRIAFFGYHSIGARCLAALLARGAQVCAVLTHQDSPEEPVWFESVADLARRHNLLVLSPPSPNTPETLQFLRTLDPDFFISVYYRRLLSSEALALPRIAAINLHGSLLPKYRGRAPLNWAIIQGEKETGVSLHHMVEEADAGDIIAQTSFPIGPDDTAVAVYRRMTDAAEILLADTFPLIVAGTAPRQPQDHRAATVFGRRRPEDGQIDWHWPAMQIHNLVRAVTHPYPGAFTTWKGNRLFIWQTWLGPPHLDPLPLRVPSGCGEGGERGRTSKARWDITDAVTNSRVPATPGMILDVQGEGITVQTGVGCVLVRSLQVDGQAEVPGSAFLKQGGARLGGILGQ